MPIPGWASREEEPPTLDNTLSKDIVNDWIFSRIEIWEEARIGDERLWEEFQRDFNGWTADYFAIAILNALKLLRDYLREWGVYAPTRDRTKKELAIIFEDILGEEERVQWSNTTFQKLKENGELKSRGL